MPNDLSIYEQAFLHRSSSMKAEKGKWVNNERLEFLGDAVLDTIVADILFVEFPNKREGFLTNTRSKIVQRETLNKLAIELGLDKLVVSSTKRTSHNNYMYGNALEAFVGAIYLDQGYDVCKQFVLEKMIKPYIDLETVSRKEVNFKSKLIEWAQKNKVSIEFDLIESFVDHDNNPVFQTRVTLMGIEGCVGTGYTKKESQQNAAKATMRKVKSEQAFADQIRQERDRIKAEALAAAEALESESTEEVVSEQEAIETTEEQKNITSSSSEEQVNKEA